MTYTKFINCATLSIFNTNKELGIIGDSDIVFIEDTNQIWTHDKFYSCPYTREEIDSMISSASSGSSLTKENIEKVLTGNIASHTHSQYLTSETDPTVPSWAKSSTKPTYTASEVGALASNGTAVNASKVANSLVLKLNSGTTEGTNLYTFNGSSSKTLDIKSGSNISFSSSSGVLTINSTNTTYSLVGANGSTGLIKNGSSVTSASGYTACPIVGGIPYYKDTNTTYTLGSFGITATAAQLNYCSGVTSNIQTQLNSKASTGQTFYIGTTQVAINRGSAALTLSGVNVSGSSGSCTGNASTATKLATARNIALTGSVTGNANFDGSGNISISTTTNHSHSNINSRGNVTCETGTNLPAVSGLSMSQAYNNGYPTSYGNVMTLRGYGSGQLLIGWSGTSGAHAPVYVRSKRDTGDANWSAWAQVYTSANPQGSVTGNAGTATKLATARNIALTGMVTGNANFDGSGNISISTSITDLGSVITITKSLKLTTSWMDTGILLSSVGTGTFVVQVGPISDNTVGAGQYDEGYSGIMYSYSGGSNSTAYDEIPLHRCGHAPNSGYIYLRTMRVSNYTSSPKLQIASSIAYNAALNITFKFRRLL